MKTVKERFLKYVSFDTQSQDGVEEVPSTAKQLELAKFLVEELNELGLSEVELLDHGYVFATLPATIDKDLPVLGFIAHMDTSDAISGANIRPREIENYDGGDIVLNEALNVVMKVSDFPTLPEFKGETLIVTDGTTLLGADDKAGIAEIISMVAYFKEHPEIEHGKIRIGFTPDEEVGNGTKYFDVDKFGADYAYTVDGGRLGELEYESFNAAGAVFKIKGKSVHPGTAKGKLINASLIAAEIVNSFPADEVPEKTEGYEGFYFLDEMKSNCEEGEVVYIIRDHDKAKFLAKKEFVKELVEKINKKYGREVVKLELKDEYYNMGEIIKDHMYVVDIAKQAMENLGIKPIIKPIRGGTDGSKISFMGLPTPNIFAGGENFHGKYEFVALESMEKATDVIVEIVKLNAER